MHLQGTLERSGGMSPAQDEQVRSITYATRSSTISISRNNVIVSQEPTVMEIQLKTIQQVYAAGLRAPVMDEVKLMDSQKVT